MTVGKLSLVQKQEGSLADPLRWLAALLLVATWWGVSPAVTVCSLGSGCRLLTGHMAPLCHLLVVRAPILGFSPGDVLFFSTVS